MATAAMSKIKTGPWSDGRYGLDLAARFEDIADP
jgi:hypothetical protein